MLTGLSRSPQSVTLAVELSADPTSSRRFPRSPDSPMWSVGGGLSVTLDTLIRSCSRRGVDLEGPDLPVGSLAFSGVATLVAVVTPRVDAPLQQPAQPAARIEAREEQEAD